MPSPETDCLEQKAVLWEKSGDDDHGDPTVSAAVEIDVRWIEKRREMTDPAGGLIVVDAVVVVDRVIAVGSILWKGEEDDLPDDPTAADAFQGTSLKQVVARKEVPDIKGDEFYRTVGVMRYGNTLPTIL